MTRFRVIDRGQGKVALQCVDGRFVKVYGDGLPGDVRFTTDAAEADVFLWQDYLDHDFMLLSLKTHRYLGKSPTTVGRRDEYALEAQLLRLSDALFDAAHGTYLAREAHLAAECYAGVDGRIHV